jgi:isoamylase
MSESRKSERSLGAHCGDVGVWFSVEAQGADAVELCIVSPDDRTEERRIELEASADGVYQGYVLEAGPGTLYAYRVHGRYAPRDGLRFNGAKRLVDPRAHAITGELRWHEDQCGFLREEGPDSTRPDPVDSAHCVPPAAVVDHRFDWSGDRHLRTPLDESFIYECHVKGLTIAHPRVAPELRGRYAGLASDPMIEHLLSLGVTAIELLPVQHKLDERHLVERGLTNYWGYNPIGWLAPDARFASSDDGSQVKELKAAIKRLHEAGIEVLLDVVFNHSGEGDHRGPTVSLKGFGNATYYDLDPRRLDRYRDFSGCGAGLRTEHVAVQRLILDALHVWVREYHVDGFRFDLAGALARENGDIAEDLGILRVIAEDPILADIKLIAEPWDATGTSVSGRLPARWSEWNGEFRDDVRRAWRRKEAGHGRLGRFASRLTGSSHVYAAAGLGCMAGVNYVASHDGPTLADLTSYERKHNELNGEANRDGPSESFADSWGIEGPSTEPAIVEARDLARRNLVASLALSLGVPMLQHGDELGRTQSGNDNGYCQDGPLTWMDWRTSERDGRFLDFVRRVFALRRSLATFRRRAHFTGERGSDGVRDLSWYDARGQELTSERWDTATVIAALYDGRPTGDGMLALLLNAGAESREFTLPVERRWQIRLATATGFDDDAIVESSTTVPARSLVLLQSAEANAGTSR